MPPADFNAIVKMYNRNCLFTLSSRLYQFL
nr:MAG TPA: hypothetical protein [Caudoviricetes sp.]